MAAYPYRPYRPLRKYRYRRHGRSGNKELLVVVGVVMVIGTAVSHPAALKHAASAGIPAPAVHDEVPVTSGSQVAFIRAVLGDMSAQSTPADIRSLEDWFPHEGTAAKNNPMASTMDAPGATVFNYDNVRNYPTAAEGAEETARTLDDGRYPLIVAALDSGRGLCGDAALAGEFLTWSGDGYEGVC